MSSLPIYKELTKKLQNPVYLELYKEGLLDPKSLRKFDLRLSDIEYRSLLYHFRNIQKRYYPDPVLYDSRENNYFIKTLQLSNGLTYTVKSKDIKKRLTVLLRQNNWLTSKEYAIAVILNKYTNQVFTRNY